MNRRIFIGLLVLGPLAGTGCDRSGATGTAEPISKSSESPAAEPAEKPPAKE